MVTFLSRIAIVAAITCVGLAGSRLAAEDWPMLGRDGTRNSVSHERGAPIAWSFEQRGKDGVVIRESRGVRWSAPLGSTTFSSPVVASGLVWIGTYGVPAGEKDGNRSVGMLKCFRVSDGQPVFEFLSPPLGGRPHDEGWHGLGSSPLVEGDRLWIATNRAEVHCLDIGPLIRGDGVPRELWKLDLIKTFSPFQRTTVMGPPRPCSIGASWKGRIFVTINNGVDVNQKIVPKPDAPSLVCLNQETGEPYWQDNSPGANILVTQFSSPTVAEIDGQVQVIVPQSDGWVRSFDPESGAKRWEFDINPKTSIYKIANRSGVRNSLLGNAVLADGRIYIASGRDAEEGEGAGRLVCIDPTRRGDVSSELAVDANDQPLPQRREQAVNPMAGEKAIPNPNSALIWEFVSQGKEFEDAMHRSMSSVAVAKGRVIAADSAGLVHCFDARTGARHWVYDTYATIWAAPLIVDDKVFVADEDGDVTIFQLKDQPHAPWNEVNMANSLYSSPAFSNGTLYVAGRNRLVAITGDKEAEAKLAVLAAVDAPTQAADWPQYGRDGTRNAVSPERNPPTTWDIGKLDQAAPRRRIASTQRNIKWSASLGNMTYGDPVVVDGLVWVGTNNSYENRTDASVLACFRESDGKLLYRYVSRRSPLGQVHDWPTNSMACSPLVEGDRIWFVTNRAEVVCLDIGPLHRDGSEPQLLWKIDLIEKFGVFPRGSMMTLAHVCSIAGYKDSIYVVTNNGVDEAHHKVQNPAAPSVICFRKTTGDTVWQDNSPGADILYSQWSSATIIEVNGRAQCVAAQGDGWVRSFDALTGKPIWQFDMNHKETVWKNFGRSTRLTILASPVFADGRIYIASGNHPEMLETTGRLVCIDPGKQGDISSELAVDAEGRPMPHRRIQAVDSTKDEKAIPNPNSGMVWEFVRVPNSKKFEETMHGVVSNVVVHQGLVIALDFTGLVHCLDSKTGRRHWSHDLLCSGYASPLIVDGKIYLADEDGKVTILGLSADPAIALGTKTGDAHLPQENDVGTVVHCSPIFANGVLYIATRSELFAIAAGDNDAMLKSPTGGAAIEARERILRSVFVPTPTEIVDKMLELVDVKRSDIVCDLGSGDGRIVIAAAKKFGCKSIGFELDRELVSQSRTAAEAAGVKSLVTIEQKDLFTADLSNVDVLTVYLLPQQLEKLLPQIEKMKPGARIVSHQFQIPGISPDKTVTLQSSGEGTTHAVHLWTLPLAKK